jgi:hypothetical protein
MCCYKIDRIYLRTFLNFERVIRLENVYFDFFFEISNIMFFFSWKKVHAMESIIDNLALKIHAMALKIASISMHFYA